MAKKKKEMSVEQEEKQRASNRQIMVKMMEEGTDPPEIYHPWKEALKKPIEMPEQEIDLSEYEMIRRANIKAIKGQVWLLLASYGNWIKSDIAFHPYLNERFIYKSRDVMYYQ